MPHRCIPLLRQTGFRGAVFLALAAGAFPVGSRAEAGKTSAAAEQAFVEQGVDVDVTAGNANQARDQAILQAQREALARLFRKLTPAADGRQPPAVSQGELEALVAGFELEQERASSVRYVGRFTVRFRPAAVRQLLQQNGVRYAEMVGKPALVLPLDATGGSPRCGPTARGARPGRRSARWMGWCRWPWCRRTLPTRTSCRPRRR
ncbi:DUF2066 domain-containing protein [Nitrospirillum sp. BR 11163]|uniref:DUF2066 domain-containing protein n=1 Tax=Nitrospirillum sp. BR 11163 TaxID=3104323 RepID=UPI002AFFC4C5|nr:DUF2066 domain-containing protein [Nitrospirillum sp. BR 11163]MEA1674960.1 DUF2066 domain-containing protein [Nitrospirillum sp. BR 11163]